MNGSCNNESIIAALRKSETIKDDYDALRKRYADLIASHSAATSKLKSAQEEARNVLSVVTIWGLLHTKEFGISFELNINICWQ